MKRKLAVAIVLVIIITSIATATLLLTNSDSHSWIPAWTPGQPKYDYLSGVTLIPGEYREAEYNEITGDYRPKYEGMTAEQYHAFFGNLPKFPKDFFQITKLVYEGKVKDFGRISESYWKQPEFYASWFSIVNNTYIHNDPNMWTPEGYGMFPLIKEVTVKRGTTVLINAYLRTGFGVESYQGIILRPYLPKTAKSITGEDLFNNPENANQYIHATITNPDNPIYESFKDKIPYTNVGEDDWFVILKPTYLRQRLDNGTVAVTGFPSDWVRMVNLEITVDEDTPPGMYVVAIESYTPCFDINQEFYYSQDHEYYGALYYPAGRFHRTNIPHFQVIMEVK